MDNAIKTRLDAAEPVSKKVVHKTTEAADELIGIKTWSNQNLQLMKIREMLKKWIFHQKKRRNIKRIKTS